MNPAGGAFFDTGLPANLPPRDEFDFGGNHLEPDWLSSHAQPRVEAATGHKPLSFGCRGRKFGVKLPSWAGGKVLELCVARNSQAEMAILAGTAGYFYTGTPLTHTLAALSVAWGLTNLVDVYQLSGAQ